VAGEPQPSRVVGTIPFDTLVAGSNSTCGLEGGVAYCWGSNFRWQLGIGSADPGDSRAEPTPAAGDLNFTLLGAGGSHFCGVTTDDETYCWGEHNGAVPSGEGRMSDAPVLVATQPSFVAITGGTEYSCGLTAAGATLCWGLNDLGQLGHDALDGSETPTLLEGGFAFVALTTGRAHTCGLTAAGEAYCWGENNDGQLGRGERNFTPNPDPQPVVGGLSFKALSAGFAHMCGITVDGDAYCWGALELLGGGTWPPLGSVEAQFSAVPVRVVAPMG
jgi:alpha-tubulin suppressor-like RCC1 family protein